MSPAQSATSVASAVAATPAMSEFAPTCKRADAPAYRPMLVEVSCPDAIAHPLAPPMWPVLAVMAPITDRVLPFHSRRLSAADRPSQKLSPVYEMFTVWLAPL